MKKQTKSAKNIKVLNAKVKATKKVRNNKVDATKKELFYNEISGDWANKINNIETNKRLEIIFTRFLNSGDLKGKKFLEVGCGLGYFSNRAFKHGAKVTGIDVGPKLIEINRKKTPKGKFLVASASKLPFKDGSFETILSTEVIEHVDRQKEALKEMSRILAPGGSLTITTPNRIFKPLFDFLSLTGIRPYHGNEKWYFPWDLKNELLKTGLKLEKEYYFNLIYPNPIFDYLENLPLVKFLCINYGIKLQKP